MSDGQIHLAQRGHVAWITIDNEPKRNAMSLNMWRQLTRVLQAIGADVRCVVVAGAGNRAFVSGADISEFVGKRCEVDDVALYDRAAEEAMSTLYQMSQPVVAMIQGYCIGAGTAIALCCDVRIAAESSQFAIPAARLGLGYGRSDLQRLLNSVSTSAAIDILSSARRLGSAEALSIGLVNRVVPNDVLAKEVEAYATSITHNAPLTIVAAKRSIRELATMGGAGIDEAGPRLTAACFASSDYLEGIKAFVEKRPPAFEGR